MNENAASLKPLKDAEEALALVHSEGFHFDF
jgi:hypothetical protein